MMLDKSEVIYSLECCKQGKAKDGCAFCFYRHKGCFEALASDAQNLLECQDKFQNRDMITKEVVR